MLPTIVRKSKYLRIEFAKQFRRLFLKAISSNEMLPPHTRNNALVALSKIRVHGSKIRNFCYSSGRGRGVYRAFSLARSKVHMLAGCGYLPGVKKSGW